MKWTMRYAQFAGSLEAMSKPGFYTVEEMQALTGLSRATVYQAARKGQIPCKRIGRRIVFNRANIDSWLASDCNDGAGHAKG